MAVKYSWNDSLDKQKMHWKSWNSLCVTKELGGLCFRNFKVYNYAMLAKQAWWILSNPNTPLSKILKAKYFPVVDFLQASLGSCPSLTWHGILEGRKVLNIGCRLRVRSSNSIRIWVDRWLPRPHSFLVNSPCCHPPLDAHELIDNELSCWDVSLNDDIFWPEEAELIKLIPLGRVWATDRWVWHYKKNGKFTLRSAYHITMNSEIIQHNWLIKAITAANRIMYGRNFGLSILPVSANIYFGLFVTILLLLVIIYGEY